MPFMVKNFFFVVEEQLLLQARDMDYVPHLKEHSEIAVDVVARVQETAQVYSQRDVFMIKKPDLILKVSDQMYIGECKVNFRG
jgi:hypothetical protein